MRHAFVVGMSHPDEPATRPTTLHVDPVGVSDTARHYIRDLVYGANDGIITTFAVVSGALSYRAILIIGARALVASAIR